MLKKIIILLFLVTGFSQHLNYKIISLSLEEGISQNTINSMTKGKYGFMWFATQNGLNRYDGYEFKVYYRDKTKQNTLFNNNIYSLFTDVDGNLWLSYEGGGFSKFNPLTEQITDYTKQFPKLRHIVFSKIIQDNKKNLWFATYDKGVYRFDPVNNSITEFTTDNNKKFPTNSISGLEKDLRGNIIVFTYPAGILKINSEKLSIEKVDIPSLRNEKIFAGKVASNGNYYYATSQNEIYSFNPVTGQEINYNLRKSYPELKTDYIITIEVDKNSDIWVGSSNNGLFKIASQNNFITKYSKTDPVNTINDNRINCIIIDKDDLVWIGTSGAGVNIIKPYQKQFLTINNKVKPNSFSDNVVFPIIKDRNNNFWVGIQGKGLDKLDRFFTRKENYCYGKTGKYSLSDYDVTALLEDYKGHIWAGTQYGIDEINPTTGLLKQYSRQSRNPIIKANGISHIYETKDSCLWIATFNGGISKISKDRKTVTFYQSDTTKKNWLRTNTITYIYEAHDGIMWFGSLFGLYRLDRSKNRFDVFQTITGDEFSISDNSVSVIYEDNYKNLWIGTNDGLNKYDDRKNKFYNFTMKDGLPNNVIYGILEDGKKNLWLSTGKGISKFNQELELFRNYFVFDGIQGDEFNSNSFFKSKDGRLYFGGFNGVTVFYPDSIKDNETIPQIVVTKLKIGNKEIKIDEEFNNRKILDKNIFAQKKIILNYNEMPVTFEYCALNFIAPGRSSYSYKMENLEDNWNDVGQQRTVTYSKIPAGEYVFKVKASNADGVWNTKGVEITLVVLPPFYESFVFRIVIISLVVFLLYFLYKLRIRTIERKKEKLENLVLERTEELRESNRLKDKYFSILAHDLKNPFMSLFGYTDILKNEVMELSREDIKEIIMNLERNIKNLFSLLENLLNWSTLQTGKMKFINSKVNINSIIDNNIELLSENANRKGIKIVYEPLNESRLFTDKNVLNTILRNLISNAIKFTPNNGEIYITGTVEKNKLKISVKDNGIGMETEEIEKILLEKDIHSKPGTNNEKGTGLGLSLCYELLTKNGGKMEIHSELNIGTTITFLLPIE